MIQENEKKTRHRHDDGKQHAFLLHAQRRDAATNTPLMSSKLRGIGINLNLRNHILETWMRETMSELETYFQHCNAPPRAQWQGIVDETRLLH